MIELHHESKTPLYEQIYLQLRRGIAAGIYQPASKLPSIRALSAELRCSRNTIEAAYQMLVQEGIALGVPGSGYVVERDALLLLAPYLDEPIAPAMQGNGLARTPQSDSRKDAAPLEGGIRYDFTYGDLQPGTFPIAIWRSLTDDVLLGPEVEKGNLYTDNAGDIGLRREIARQQAATRGVRCTPEQVIVQAGTQAALQNLLLLFDPARDAVAMEDPGYDGAREVFENNHFRLLPCPIEPYGEKPYLESVRESGARLAFATPSNQFPTGIVMDADTRLQLIDWAHGTGAYIIEDDYCHEFLYRMRPLPSLQSLDHHGRVIYMGTFSKSLSPSLRINYLILPFDLLERWNDKFSKTYPSVPWLSQAVLRRYLQDDRRQRRLRQIQTQNARKYEALMDALRATMGERIDILEGGAGLHLLVNVRDGRSQAQLIETARRAGVAVYGTDQYWIARDHPLKSCVLVGFSAIRIEDITPGIEALAQAWFG